MWPENCINSLQIFPKIQEIHTEKKILAQSRKEVMGVKLERYTEQLLKTEKKVQKG